MDNKDNAENLFFPFDIRSETDIYYDYDNDIFDTLYYGFARLFGEIAFDNSDYCLKFQAIIKLSTHCEFGAGSEENDIFDVELRPHGYNYILRYPYTTVIEPYGAERVSLILKAEESSNHIFTISAKNGDDIEISSKAINIHYMSPRNYEVLEWGKENPYQEWENENFYEE